MASTTPKRKIDKLVSKDGNDVEEISMGEADVNPRPLKKQSA